MAGQAEITEIITQAALEQFDVLNAKLGESLKLMAAFTDQSAKADKAMSGSKTLADWANNATAAAQSTAKLSTAQTDVIETSKKLNETQKAYKDTLADLAKKGDTIKIVNDDVLKSYVSMKQALTAITAEQKNLAAQLKAGAITQDQYSTASAKLVQEQEKLKANSNQLIQVIKAETKENLALKGSMDEKAQRLGKLKDLYRQLSEEERNNEKVGGTLLKSIQSQDAELKKMDASIGNFQRNVGNYEKGLEGFGDTLKDLASTYLGFVGIQSVGSFIEGSVHEFEEMQKSVATLSLTLEHAGQSDALPRVKQKAEDLGKSFKMFDDSDILQGFDKLATFGKLTEAQVNQLMPVILDFAAKTGKSVPEATDAMIKAIEGGGKEMRMYGVHVSKTAGETENFNALMTQLKPKVEGAAEALGTTLAGQTQIAEVQIKQLKESIGGQLQPVVVGFYAGLEGLIDILKTGFDAAYLGFLKLKDFFTGGSSLNTELISRGAAEENEKLHQRIQAQADDFAKKDAATQKRLLESQRLLMLDAKDRYMKSKTEADRKELDYEYKLTNEFLRIFQDRNKKFGIPIKEDGVAAATPKAAAPETTQSYLYANNTPVEKAAEEEARKRAEAAIKARLDAEEKGYQKEVLYAKQAMNTEVEVADMLTGTEQEKAEARAKAKEDGAKKLLAIEIDHQQKILQILQDAGMDTVDAQQKLVDLKAKLLDQEVKDQAKAEEAKTKKAKSETEKRKEIEQEVTKVTSEVMNTIAAFVNGRYDEEKNAIQDNITQIEKKKEADLAANDASTLSAQDKAAQATLINARAQTQKEQMERRQRQIDQERAKFERAMAIARIVQSTAVAIAADIDTPWKIALDVALGAMAMAQVVSKPIPRFAHGRDGGPATLAIVGDGGRPEVIESPTGQMTVTPATPTLTFLPEDYKVHPSIDDAMESVISAGMATVPVKSGGFSEEKMANMIADAFAREAEKITQAINNRPEHITKIERDGIREIFKSNAGWIEYLKKNMS